jgi:hypothetical protein
MKKQSEPGMRDPSDKEIHSAAGRDPYPSPKKGAKDAADAENDLEDPASEDPDAPHDRGHERGGRHVSGVQDMLKRVEDNPEDWKKGRTQGGP